MDELLSTNWGDIVGAVGLAITIIGFGVAIYQANKARKAAEAAHAASQETRETIARVLTVSDLQKAIAAIQRIKDLHRDMKWEASLQHYQPLRVVLADIDARYPALTAEQHAVLREAIPNLVAIEDGVGIFLRGNSDPSATRYFNNVLNQIQMGLEGMASSTFPGSEGSK